MITALGRALDYTTNCIQRKTRRADENSHRVRSLVGVKVVHVRFLEILRDRDSALVEGVLGDGLVGVDRAKAITGHNLAVRSVTRCVFDHVVLKRQASTVFATFESFFLQGPSLLCTI